MVDYITEIYYDAAWHNITSDVRDTAPIKIARGRRDWASQTDPATLKLRLNNGASNVAPGISGRYSPRNPRSDLYGKIGRNTPVRVRHGEPTPQVARIIGDVAGFTETAASAITGPNTYLDVRLDMTPDTWDLGAQQYLIWGNIALNGTETGCYLMRHTDGLLRFIWSPDGIATNEAVSTEPLPILEGRHTLRVTVEGDDGAGGHAITFLYGADIDSSAGWTLIGDAVPGVGTTQVWAANTPIRVGSLDTNNADNSRAIGGQLHGFRYIGDGITMIDADFTGIDASSTTYTDGDGHVWDLCGVYPEEDPVFRFHGEATSWPVRWGLEGGDASWVQFTASGILRRLQRGTKPLRSTIRRAITAAAPVAYWSCESGTEATRFASAIPGDLSVLTFDTAQVSPGADATIPASAPLPTVEAGTISGPLTPYTAEDLQRVSVLLKLPATEYADQRLIFRFTTTGSLARWDILSGPTGEVWLRVYDEEGALVDEGSNVFLDIAGRTTLLSIRLRQQGSTVDYLALFFHPGLNFAQGIGGDLAGHTFGRINRVYLGSTNDMDGATFGHCFVNNGTGADLIWPIMLGAIRAYDADTVLGRMARLGYEEGVPVGFDGVASATEALGPQRARTLVDLMREGPVADLGVFSERVDGNGLWYRARDTLYNQDPALVLDYAAGVIADGIAPVDDDQATRNQIVLTRDGGGETTAIAETGRMSVQAPPEGVGRYDYSQTVSLAADNRLPEQAAFRLHLGTVDEARIPVLRLNLRNPQVEPLAAQILAVRLGDIIRIDHPPEWLPVGPYRLLVDAIEEEKTAVTHTIDFTCTPGSPWSAFVVDDPVLGRLDTAGSTLALGVDAATTTLLVATQSGSQPWVQFGPGEDTFEITAGGETMTVTAITGSTSPQTMTVTRTATSAVAHPAGTDVRVASTHVIAL